VYNSLEGIYQQNDYAGEIDYNCADGEVFIPESELTYPVYNMDHSASMFDPCTTNSSCSSKICVFTNQTVNSDDGSGSGPTVRACCAWDLYMTMGSSSDDDADDVSSPVVSYFTAN
jgi:hypothetical protein